jgi:hypothetical protein
MKKTSTYLFLLLFTMTAFAQGRKGEFRFSSPTAQHELYVAFGMQLHFDNSLPLVDQAIAQIPRIKELQVQYNFSLENGILLSDEKLGRMERSAMAISGNSNSVKRLRNIFKISIPDTNNETLLALATELEKLNDVAYCSLMSKEPVPPPEDIAPVTSDFQSQQTYIGPDPGVNMQFAWDAGIDGSGIKIRDCEYGFNKQHEEFDDNDNIFLCPDMTISSDASVSYTEHGTAVFGILYGQNTGYGVTGLVYGADELELFPEWQQIGYDRVFAVTHAIANCELGDVLIYEMQDSGQTSTGYVPAEYDNVIWDLTKAATDSGIVIVAAAGNGAQDLDSEFYAPYMARGNSGAILVGGGTPDVAHNKISYSTYGTRIDVQGWANNVFSSGYGDLYQIGGDFNQNYTHFSGTSSATPIVASCAIALQAYYFSQAGTYLTSTDLRSILEDTGIAQGAGGHIGPLPNMESALAAVDALLGVQHPEAVPFSIYPNPATAKITIGAAALNSNATVELVNSIGQVIYKSQLAGDKSVDISNLDSGFYFVKITDNGRSTVKKIIKE